VGGNNRVGAHVSDLHARFSTRPELR
jgi:hypothetical protein